MINRYGMLPLAFILIIFTILVTTIIPSSHKNCIDRNMSMLNNLDQEKYTDGKIKKFGKSIGTNCKDNYSFDLTTLVN
jgi:hypothetical protein|tara:strand:+ start:107 stop:340 length:234 start_codon:yes stop_codon:yes gene_type:complete